MSIFNLKITKFPERLRIALSTEANPDTWFRPESTVPGKLEIFSNVEFSNEGELVNIKSVNDEIVSFKLTKKGESLISQYADENISTGDWKTLRINNLTGELCDETGNYQA